MKTINYILFVFVILVVGGCTFMNNAPKRYTKNFRICIENEKSIQSNIAFNGFYLFLPNLNTKKMKNSPVLVFYMVFFENGSVFEISTIDSFNTFDSAIKAVKNNITHELERAKKSKSKKQLIFKNFHHYQGIFEDNNGVINVQFIQVREFLSTYWNPVESWYEFDESNNLIQFYNGYQNYIPTQVEIAKREKKHGIL